MRALKLLTDHVIYNPAYTYKLQLKTTYDFLSTTMTFLPYEIQIS